ncbi:MAG TPA: DUF4381 domain-containing protein [Myxococcota bacterium]|nr:DUF4381 domain-containing protein [Myxococcota bacterium]
MPDSSGALQGLAELPLPAPVPYTPETPGAWAVLVLLLAAVAALAWRALRRWRANAYRRAALRELAGLEQASDLARLPALLKRTALAARPRQRVAALSGAAWLEYLDGTMGGREFAAGPGRALATLSYTKQPSLSAEETRALLRLARDWIEHHRAGV